MTPADPESAARRPLIIQRPDLQSRTERYGYLSLTFVCWFLWLYLFVPLLSLAAWLFGAAFAYNVMFRNLDVAELVALLKLYGLGIAILTGVYLIWALTSYWRFRSLTRRGRPPDTDPAALAASHQLGVSELETLRAGQQLVLSAEQLERMFARARSAPQADAEDTATERRVEA